MNTKTGINVCSLFDGISVARQTLKELNIPVNKYYASEIEKKAIEASSNNHDDIIQIGDIRNVDTSTLPHIDLLIGGSPCQSLTSLRKNRTGLDSEDSGLFYEAVRILEELKQVNPNIKFLFENVASMATSERDKISEILGVQPIMICSSKLSPQMRKRYYWTNIPEVTQPIDKGIKFSDIIEHGYVDRDKSLVVLCKHLPQTYGGMKRYLTRGIGQTIFSDESYVIKRNKKSTWEIYNMNYENDGSTQIIDGYKYVNGARKLTITELCRLQGLDDHYMDNIAYTTAHKGLGNAFTLPVISHILSFSDFPRK